MNSIIINGTTIKSSGSISVNGNKIFIDGKDVTNKIGKIKDGILKIKIDGNIDKFIADGNIEVNGNIGNLQCDGTCKIDGDIKGNVEVDGVCDVRGDVSGSIKCDGVINR